MTPEELRDALARQPVPDHRPGFWDTLDEQLEPETSSPRPAGWLVAVAAAAAAVVVVGVGALLIGQVPLGEPDPVATDDSLVATTLESSPQSAVVTTIPAVPTTDVAPWDRGVLSIEDTPAVVATEWHLAENQLWCSALYPTDTGRSDATLRRAEFSGGWALAWDLPDLRSAFGVAGVGSPAWQDIGVRMPNAISYGAQVVGYGGEGFDDAAEQRLAEFSVPGQLCGYQVWSKLGDEHLVELVESLRLVDGLQADPIDADADGGDMVTPDRGSAPWSEESVAYPDAFPAPPTETPAFVLASGVPENTAVRTANEGSWALAWDAPDGPGHDSSNHPCRSCGRGVIGMVLSPLRSVPDTAPDARWDDGSVGFIVPRVGDPDIPLDRMLARTAGGDELVPVAPRIDIFIPDAGVVLSLWSHLGEESLFDLVDGLRAAGVDR